MKRILFFLGLAVNFQSLMAFQIDTVFVHGVFESSIEISENLENPISDVDIIVRFNGPNGQTFEQLGYWTHDKNYSFRFSPETEGEWEYTVVKKIQSNQETEVSIGKIWVEQNASDLDYKKHGRLRLSENSRYLTYSDGSPFFYLGDTAWEMVWKSTKSEMNTYINDRAKKGFTAIQMVPMSHLYLYSYGVRNRRSVPYFINEDYSRINPEYFNYLDEIVDSVNAKNMVAVLVPLWAAMCEVNYDDRWRDTYLTKEQGLLIAKYIGARYAAHNIIWIVGGDNTYATTEQQEFWNKFAEILNYASGNRHLSTVHPAGYDASFNYFDNNTDWLDFHMYQSSHIARGTYTIRAAREGYALNPEKPVLNGEAVYEDIYHRLWAPGDTTKAESFRIRAEHVRQASYESILSGSTVGITYGGNGIWQWHKDDMPGTHSPRFTVLDAINFEGSSNMSILKQFFVDHNWFNLIPSPELITEKVSTYQVSVAISDQYLISYFPDSTSFVSFVLPQNKEFSSVKFLNPRNGNIEQTLSIENPRKYKAIPPSNEDWVFIGEVNTHQIEEPSTFEIFQNYPNPFNPSTTIEYYLPDDGFVTVNVYNALGQFVTKLDESSKQKGFHIANFDAAPYASGVYFIQVRFNDNVKMIPVTLIK